MAPRNDRNDRRDDHDDGFVDKLVHINRVAKKTFKLNRCHSTVVNELSVVSKMLGVSWLYQLCSYVNGYISVMTVIITILTVI